jgi:hypothetical protein
MQCGSNTAEIALRRQDRFPASQVPGTGTRHRYLVLVPGTGTWHLQLHWGMAKYSTHILELAKRGADSRFRELLDELKFLTLSFPHLADSFDRDDLPWKFILRQGRDKALGLSPTRRRRKMSAAARKAIGDAQRARWARQKSGITKK